MKTALIVIDLQASFEPLYDSNPSLLPSISSLISLFRERQQPVIWIRSEYTLPPPPIPPSHIVRPPGPRYATAPMNTERLSSTHTGARDYCRPNTPGAEFPPSVQAMAAQSDNLITKNLYSAFTSTPLHRLLENLGVSGVVIAGVTANTCVLATSTDAFFLQYDVAVVSSCVAAFSDDMKSNALSKIAEHYGRVIPTVEEYKADRGVGNELIRDTDDWKKRTLYFVNGSIPSWRVMIALAEKNIAYDRVRLKVMSVPKQTRSARFSRLNARCKTPTLVDADGTVVIESMAILQYLERVFTSEDEKSLVPTDKNDYARVISRFQETENLHDVFDDIELLYLPPSAGNDEKVVEAYKNTLTELVFWEGYFKDGKFVAGEDFTIADCAFYPCIAYLERRGFDFDGFPALKKYVDMMKKRSSVKDACPLGWDKKGGENLWKKAGEMVAKEEGK